MTNITQNALRRIMSACLPLLCFGQVCRSQTARGPDGSWQGALGGGTAQLRLVLTITQSGGEYKCVLDSVDQGATIPADKVTLTGDKLRLEFARVNGFYEGAINKEGNEIAGSWTQNGRAQPLSFKRKEQDASASAQPAATGAQKPFTSPIDVTVAISPAAFQADGKSHVSYELRIANFSGDPATLQGIEVVSDAGAKLAKLEQADLLTSVLLPGNRQAAGHGQAQHRRRRICHRLHVAQL
ncbi:MAG TPA: hypothetical protein VE133_13195 [Candidatus Sulfotelmatobacter sp.]|nr:hypothetical protein [Candidatus Sulfotelmatobacter sp.]